MITGSSILTVKRYIEEVGLGTGIQFEPAKTLINDYSILFYNIYYQLEIAFSSYHITFKLYSIHDGQLNLESERMLPKCSEDDLGLTLDDLYNSISEVKTKLTRLDLYTSGLSEEPPFNPTIIEVVLSPDFAPGESTYAASMAAGDLKLSFDKEDWRSSSEVKLKTGETENEVTDLDKITLTTGTHLLKINLGDPIEFKSSRSYLITLTVS